MPTDPGPRTNGYTLPRRGSPEHLKLKRQAAHLVEAAIRAGRLLTTDTRIIEYTRKRVPDSMVETLGVCPSNRFC